MAKRRRSGGDSNMMSSPSALVWLSWRCFSFNFFDGRHLMRVAGVCDKVNGGGEGFLNGANVREEAWEFLRRRTCCRR